MYITAGGAGPPPMPQFQHPSGSPYQYPVLTGTRVEPLAPLFLPAALVLIPVVFQLTLLAIGVSLQEAADAGARQARRSLLLLWYQLCSICTFQMQVQSSTSTK